MNWRDLETFSFGDSPDLANELLELVLSGTKCATCWAESQGLLSAEVGKMMVVLDGQGIPRAVLKTIELTKLCARLICNARSSLGQKNLFS